LKRVQMAWLVTACSVAAWSGCGQSENETCQLQSDCQSGLMCCIGATSARGTCLDVCPSTTVTPATDAGARDASTKKDAQAEDSGE
jgi:hypothetical protein